MIYRVLVDFGVGEYVVPDGVSPGHFLADLRRRGIVPLALLHRLDRLSQPDPAVQTNPDGLVTLKLALPYGLTEFDGRLMGASFGPLAAVMNARGLKAPALRNARVRFYFTERGWRQVGRFVAGRARRMGHVVKVIRRKNPRSSEIIYRDAYQLALLPPRLRRG